MYYIIHKILVASSWYVLGLAAVLHYETSPNGFNAPVRGWNSFGLQAYGDHSWKLTQNDVLGQCKLLAENFGDIGYNICSLDSGWSQGSDGDEYGRIIADATVFPDMEQLGDNLHALNLKLGIYINPGAFANDADKTIYGTNQTLRAIMLTTGPNYVNGRWNLNWTDQLAQTWCDTNVALWAEWGVDYIKLDFVTPGSSQGDDGGIPADQDTSGCVSCYHQAIANVGRQMWLDISWALDWTSPFPYDIWKSNADSMRVDQDINNYNDTTLVAWPAVQRTIDKYRRYIRYQRDQVGIETPLTVRPDMDNLYLVNDGDLTGLTDREKRTMFYHWVGAGATLILGSDLTQLDTFGVGLVHDPVLNKIADFTATYPIQPVTPSASSGKGPQLVWWQAGPDPNTGEIVIMVANYGSSGTNDLYDPEPASGAIDAWIILNDRILTDATIDQWEIEFAAKAFQLGEHILADGVVNGAERFNITVLDADAVMFIATPVFVSKAKRTVDPRTTAAPSKTLEARNVPTTVLTQSTYPMESPGCGPQGSIVGTIPVGVEIDNGTISSSGLLYDIRSMLCTDICAIPNGVPHGAATTQQSDGAVACEISIAVSDTIEAWGYRATLPDGVEAQECWDSTAYIIERCVKKGNATSGWWNGDHAYQFYQLGFRPLNYNDTYHVRANDNLTSALTTVATVPSYTTNSSTASTTTASGAAVTTLPTAASSSSAAVSDSSGIASSTIATASASATSNNGMAYFASCIPRRILTLITTIVSVFM